MDSITAVSSAGAARPATAAKSTDSNTATAALSSDFETFLKMLSVQLQNQDPLNPVDSADYAVQLATFSSVEQQVRTNDLLEAMTSQLNVSGMADLVSWVGMEALSSSDTYFDGENPLSLVSDPALGADEAYLVIRDAGGGKVATLDMPATSGTYLWDGTDQNGKMLEAGIYSLELESYSSGDYLATSVPQTYTRVVEARRTASGTELILSTGQTVDAADVSGLRWPTT